jgi:hypothetical protein
MKAGIWIECAAVIASSSIPIHPERRVTVAGHLGEDLPPKTLRSIFRQAGWEEEQ